MKWYRMKPMAAGFLLFTLLCLNCLPSPRSESVNAEVERILADIQTLSGQDYEGRQAGTEGGAQSARFVADRFQELGLQPLFRKIKGRPNMEWFQEFPLTVTRILPTTKLALFINSTESPEQSQPLIVGTDYLPILDSPPIHTTAPVTFVGYGIHDPARHRDDYQGLHVQNRIVMFLRGKPPTYAKWVTHEEKARWAKQQGAIGYLTVTGPKLNRYEARKGLGQNPLAIYAESPEHRPLPGAWINGSTLDAILSKIESPLGSLQQKANETSHTASRPLPLLANFQCHSQTKPGTLLNVIGVLPGTHPSLKEEYVIIGAHRDHFGTQAGLVFSGADDNASGTAVMLETARTFIKEKLRPQRTLLFVSFDGEERGLMGSRFYVNHFPIDLQRTVAMINLDHVGVGNGSFTVGVTRIKKDRIQEAADQGGLSQRIKLYGYFPGGDHVPFFEAEVPTITIVSAGIHPHFHQATDRFESINPEIIQTASHLVFAIVNRLANSK